MYVNKIIFYIIENYINENKIIHFVKINKTCMYGRKIPKAHKLKYLLIEAKKLMKNKNRFSSGKLMIMDLLITIN